MAHTAAAAFCLCQFKVIQLPVKNLDAVVVSSHGCSTGVEDEVEDTLYQEDIDVFTPRCPPLSKGGMEDREEPANDRDRTPCHYRRDAQERRADDCLRLASDPNGPPQIGFKSAR